MKMTNSMKALSNPMMKKKSRCKLRAEKTGKLSSNFVADENGSTEPLRNYKDKTLVIVLPGDLTVFDVEWLSVWCVAFFVDFGHVSIPKNLNVPPSLRMLGVEPQTKLNCEVLAK